MKLIYTHLPNTVTDGSLVGGSVVGGSVVDGVRHLK